MAVNDNRNLQILPEKSNEQIKSNYTEKIQF